MPALERLFKLSCALERLFKHITATLWGTQSASVSYTQIIPVLVKSNQELHERIVEHDAQIADLEAAVASRDQQIDELRSELSDTVSRLEAVESG